MFKPYLWNSALWTMPSHMIVDASFCAVFLDFDPFSEEVDDLNKIEDHCHCLNLKLFIFFKSIFKLTLQYVLNPNRVKWDFEKCMVFSELEWSHDNKPYEKAQNSFMDLKFPSSPRNLSGMNFSGSSHTVGSRCIDARSHSRTVFLGISLPSMCKSS